MVGSIAESVKEMVLAQMQFRATQAMGLLDVGFSEKKELVNGGMIGNALNIRLVASLD